MSEVALIESTIRNIQTSISVANQQLAQARAEGNTERVTELTAYIAELNQSLAQANASLQAAKSAAPTSAGQVVAEEQRAKSNGAAVQNPATQDAPSNTGNNVPPANQVEVGTDGRIRTTQETQSTPPANAGSAIPFASPGDEDQAQVPFANQQGGAGARNEDSPSPNTNRTSQIINARFNRRITPQSNVLDEYASYTYALTWYLLTPTQYNEMITSQKRDCANWQLLMQSGGAATQQAGSTGNSTVIGGRNKYFSKDYYLDNLEIESRIPFKGTGAADGRVSIKFTVMEPNGITLIENLYKAVSDLYKQTNVTKTANYATAQYCLVIRFYGYNENGDLVTTGRRGTNGQNNLTDPRAIVEKFYPFLLADIKFKIPKDRIVEYAIEGKPIPHFYNKSQDRGTIPFSFELTGQTAEQVLRGRPTTSATPPSPGERRDSPQPNTTAPNRPSAIDPNQAGSAQVDENGNFTGVSNSAFQVGA